MKTKITLLGMGCLLQGRFADSDNGEISTGYKDGEGIKVAGEAQIFIPMQLSDDYRVNSELVNN